MNTPLLEIRLFGALDAAREGQPLPALRSRTEKWLLMLLALRPGHPLSREWLAATLWPDSDPALGLYNLRRALTNLRKALGTPTDLLLSPTPQTIALDRAHVRVDVADFDAAIAVGSMESLEQAVALYRGSLLEDCTEDWALAARIEREQAYLAALETLAAHSASHHLPTVAVRYLRLTIAADPLREAAQCALMQALADCGDYAAITQVYRDLRLLLHRELNVAPAAETETLYRQLQQQARQTVLPPPPPVAGPPRRLPVPLTTLVGRETETAEIVDRLQKARLVTLLGPGGVGKTRLAIAGGEILVSGCPDGVWFVDLASLTDPALTIHAVAGTLGIKEERGRSLVETLTAALEARSLLLILDNCEHLLDACATLAATLLSRCCGVRILATSREALGLVGEHRYATPSLALPPNPPAVHSLRSGEKDLAWLMEYGGMRLFVERAVQAQPAFRLTRQNAVQALSVVEALDGIPLAIELAAARLRSLSLGEIQTRLQDRFQLLTGGSRAALPRQQTLRALIDWSYDLLTERERRLLQRLSVFAGGWTLEVVEVVCADPSPKTRQANKEAKFLVADEVFDVLTALVDKSLVIYEALEGQTRYRLLETVRQYAADRLRENEEVATYPRRHRDYFLALAEKADRELKGPTLQQWLTRLEIEHDNLRQALSLCLEAETHLEDPLQENGESGLRLGAALQRFWLIHGHLSEGRQYLDALLRDSEAQEPTKARAAVLLGAGRLGYAQGDYAAAGLRNEEGLKIYREMGDKQGIANALMNLGNVAWKQSDYPRAHCLHAESLTMKRALGDLDSLTDSLGNLALVVYSQGDLVFARTLQEESLKISRELGDLQGISTSLMNLALVNYAQGDLVFARSQSEEGLALKRELGDSQGVANALMNLGNVAWKQGDPLAARALYEESLTIKRELGDRHGMASSLGNLAVMAYIQGNYAATRSLLEESLGIYRESGYL